MMNIAIQVVCLRVFSFLRRILETDKRVSIILSIFPRLWDLEKQIKQLRNYRDNYQSFCKWLYDAKRRQDSLESMKFGDSNTVMRFLNEQKV